jgi:putative ABC transport system permease protein
MNMIQFMGAIELGLIYSLVALGVYLSFRTLQFPDMTVDGSFPLGAAVAGSSILLGFNPFIATFFAMLAGAFFGYITAFMSTRLKMLNLLAGILTMTALYSVNLRIMGRPNLALLGETTIPSIVSPFLKPIVSCFSGILPDMTNFLILAAISILVVLLINWFLKTRLGIALRSTGSNPRMARSIGINDDTMIQIGISLSNAIVALAGALFAQFYGFADVSMGVGTIVIGLAALIIGEALFHARRISLLLVSCVIGAILYRLVIAFALNSSDLGLQASDLNLVTALLVAIAMMIPTLKRKIKRGEKQ